MKTHPNFKSFCPDFKDADAIYKCMKFVFENKLDFGQAMAGSEAISHEKRRKLFDNIDVEQFDRLYYINKNIEEEGIEEEGNYKFRNYELIARMDFDSPTYIHLVVRKYNDWDYGGSIFISQCPNLFMEHSPIFFNQEERSIEPNYSHIHNIICAEKNEQ